jgi:phage protein D
MTTDQEHAAPTPVFEVAGRTEAVLSRDVLRLRIAEDTAGLRHLEAEFKGFGPGAGADDELLYLDRRILDFGRSIRVSLGVPGRDRSVFGGQISEISVHYGNGTPPVVGISAEDGLMKLRMTRRNRTSTDVTDGDLISQIGADHGMRVDVDLDGPTYDIVHQANQTDLAFIRERARQVNGEVWFLDGTLHASTRSRRPGTKVQLDQNNDLIGITARADLADQRSEVAVSGYDASKRDAIREVAGSSVAAAEVAGGQLGVTVLERAFGSLRSSRAADVPLTATEAQAWARGEMLERARRFTAVSGVTRGTAELGVGSIVELVNVAPMFDGGGYYVTSVCHRFDTVNGFSTAFEAERATIGGPR